MKTKKKLKGVPINFIITVDNKDINNSIVNIEIYCNGNVGLVNFLVDRLNNEIVYISKRYSGGKDIFQKPKLYMYNISEYNITTIVGAIVEGG